MTTRILIIAGVPRSGTTAVRWILSRLPHCVAFNELGDPDGSRPMEKTPKRILDICNQKHVPLDKKNAGLASKRDGQTSLLAFKEPTLEIEEEFLACLSEIGPVTVYFAMRNLGELMLSFERRAQDPDDRWKHDSAICEKMFDGFIKNLNSLMTSHLARKFPKTRMVFVGYSWLFGARSSMAEVFSQLELGDEAIANRLFEKNEIKRAPQRRIIVTEKTIKEIDRRLETYLSNLDKRWSGLDPVVRELLSSPSDLSSMPIKVY